MKQFENVYYFFSNNELNPYQFFKKHFLKETKTQEQLKDTNGKRPLRTIDIDKTSGEFIYTNIDTNYNCSYNYQKLDHKNTVFKVTLVLKYINSKEKAAHAFSDLIQTIKAKKQDDFYMTVIKDSLSTYYSERLYSKLAFYERSMRSLITSIFIPVYKETWVERLEDSVGNMPKVSKKQRMEGLLEDLNLSDLESIFFDAKMKIDVDNYDSEFKINRIETISKDEIVKIIKSNRPVSLWESEISKYAYISDAQIRMDKIRKHRNKIAHNKAFSEKNFRELRKELNFITPKLNEAEDKILNNHDLQSLQLTLQRTAERMVDLNLKILAPNLKVIENISEALRNMIPREIFSFANLPNMAQFGMLNLIENLEIPNSEYKDDYYSEED